MNRNHYQSQSRDLGLKPGPKVPPRPPMPPAPPKPPMPPAPPSDKPKPGRQGEGSNKGLTGVEVYQKECAVCHGKEGEGTERGYPLKFVKSRFAELVTRQGRKIPPEFEIDMPAYDEEIVSRKQMTEMLDYLWDFPQPESGKNYTSTIAKIAMVLEVLAV